MRRREPEKRKRFASYIPDRKKNINHTETCLLSDRKESVFMNWSCTSRLRSGVKCAELCQKCPRASWLFFAFFRQGRVFGNSPNYEEIRHSRYEESVSSVVIIEVTMVNSWWIYGEFMHGFYFFDFWDFRTLLYFLKTFLSTNSVY